MGRVAVPVVPADSSAWHESVLLLCLGKGPRLYVGGVPDEISEEQIVEHFNKWGNVVDVYFPGKKGAKRVGLPYQRPLWANPVSIPLPALLQDHRLQAMILVKEMSQLRRVLQLRQV